MTAEEILEYLIDHRGEAMAEYFLSRMAKEKDYETVESTRAIISMEFNAEDSEIMGMVIDHMNRKHRREVRRDRKIADNREHQRKLAQKRMEYFVEV